LDISYSVIVHLLFNTSQKFLLYLIDIAVSIDSVIFCFHNGKLSNEDKAEKHQPNTNSPLDNGQLRLKSSHITLLVTIYNVFFVKLSFKICLADFSGNMFDLASIWFIT